MAPIYRTSWRTRRAKKDREEELRSETERVSASSESRAEAGRTAGGEAGGWRRRPGAEGGVESAQPVENHLETLKLPERARGRDPNATKLRVIPDIPGVVHSIVKCPNCGGYLNLRVSTECYHCGEEYPTAAADTDRGA